jgi:fatty-acyl-CoA synthase
MPPVPLTVRLIFEHGRKIHPDSEVCSFAPEGSRRVTFAELATEADRLAAGLQREGIGRGDAVGTFCWNHQEHLAAYFAVPCLNAVLHTVNIRLFAEQIAYVINHGEERVLLVDASLLPKIQEIADQLEHVELFVIVGETANDPTPTPSLPARTISYRELLAEEGAQPDWPEIDELDAAAMCYTSGTTGNPRGVVYGHRSTFLHSLAQCSGASFSLSERDRILLIVPMFHANAWGLPYSGWMVGADFVMPGPLLQGEPLARIIEETKPTFMPGVATVLRDLLDHSERHGVALDSVRLALCGGAPVPASLIRGYAERGVPLLQGWGMTETSPLAALAHPPRDADPADEVYWRTKTGRPIAGVQMRIVDEDGAELPWDGRTVGEIEVRGPWVTAAYHKDPAPEKFRDGWLRTGDVGYGDAKGYVQLTDRTKDVIKSGGEWISSVEVENELMGHPDVLEASVIGIPDERWDERPLACIVLRDGAEVDPPALAQWLDGRIAKWWIPQRWAVLDEVPKTSVGKFDKKRLRAGYQDGEYELVSLERAN